MDDFRGRNRPGRGDGGPALRNERRALRRAGDDEGSRGDRRNEAELVRKNDRMVWDVDVVGPRKTLYTLDIDAKTGAILRFAEEK